MNKLMLIFLAFVFLFAVPFGFVSAQVTPCDPTSNMACEELITEPGHGAVELCNNCFVCGANDGVCPAWYSTGEVGDNISVLLRKGELDRPATNSYIGGTDFATPNDACNYFGGEVLSIEAKSNYDDVWGPPSIGENDLVGPLSNYVRVNCTNVPARPSCDICVDPDCHTMLKGVAYAPVTGGAEPIPIPGVNVFVVPRYNPDNNDLHRYNVSLSDGSFEISNAYSGEVTVYCSAEGFDSVEKNVTLLPGYNIVDCRMPSGVCDADCTFPSAQFGVRVCSSACQGQNGCDFGENIPPEDTITADDLMGACDGRIPGTFRELHVERDEAAGTVTVTGVVCCTNYPEVRTYPLFNIFDSDDITNLLTRRFNKLLPDGSPVFLNIVVYNKR